MELNQELLMFVLAAGPVISLITLAVRQLLNRYGYELGSALAQIIVFAIGVIVAVALQYAPQEVLVAAGGIFMTALTFYDVVVKTILGGLLDKFKK